MAKKSFGAGATKPGILNTDGGEVERNAGKNPIQFQLYS